MRYAMRTIESSEYFEGRGAWPRFEVSKVGFAWNMVVSGSDDVDWKKFGWSVLENGSIGGVSSNGLFVLK